MSKTNNVSISWIIGMVLTSNSSWHFASTSQDYALTVSLRHHGKEKESLVYQGCACAQGAIVATAGYKADLSSDRQNVSWCPRVYAWIRRQIRRTFSRTRLLLQSSQRLAPWASWLADNWSCSCACSEGAELVGGAVETFHLRWMDGSAFDVWFQLE